MFKKLEGDTVMLRQGGIYKPVDLYEWNGGLYAQLGGGYIRLRKDGTTTKAGVDFVHMEVEAVIYADKFGRLATSHKEGYTRLEVLADHADGEVLRLAAPGG